MSTLTVTSRGQVTFRKEALQHLGIEPGDKLELELLPNGNGLVKAAKATGSINSFIGLLADKTQKLATIEQMNAAIAEGWGNYEDNR